MKLLLIVFLASAVTNVAYGEESALNVYVDVSGKNESVIFSYITRELRDLSDVKVVSEESAATYSIRVVTTRIEVGGDFKGYSISWVAARRFDKEMIIGLVDLVDATNAEWLKSIKDYVAATDAVDLMQHIVVTVPAKYLKGKCEELVAEFDSEVLESMRQAKEEFERKKQQKEELRKKIKKAKKQAEELRKKMKKQQEELRKKMKTDN